MAEQGAPRRIQRQRTKGWRMPEHAVYVGRPSAWGNPFALDDPWLYWAAVAMGLKADIAGRREASVRLYRVWLTGSLPPIGEPEPGGEITFDSGRTISAHGMVMGLGARLCCIYDAPKVGAQPDLTPLRGKNLACWCPLDQPCHADVLLELANQEVTACR